MLSDMPIVIDERTLAGDAQLLLGFFGSGPKEWVWEKGFHQAYFYPLGTVRVRLPHLESSRPYNSG